MDQMRNFSGLGDVTTRGQEKVFAVVSRHAIINGKKSEHVVIFDDHPASLCLLRELQLTPPRQNLFRYAMLAVVLIVALCLAMFWPLL